VTDEADLSIGRGELDLMQLGQRRTGTAHSEHFVKLRLPGCRKPIVEWLTWQNRQPHHASFNQRSQLVQRRKEQFFSPRPLRKRKNLNSSALPPEPQVSGPDQWRGQPATFFAPVPDSLTLNTFHLVVPHGRGQRSKA
jgi:hypothetical protein